MQTIGRQGGGPGEFNFLRRLVLGPGDSIFVESGYRAISVLDRNGAFVRTILVTAGSEGPTSPSLQAVFPDGGMLMAAATDAALPRESGVFRVAETFWRYTPEGAPVGTALAQSPGGARLVNISKDGLELFGFPFAARSLSVVTGSALVVGATDLFGFEQVDLASGVRRLVRIDAPLVPLTSDLIEAATTRMLTIYRRLDARALAALQARLVDAARQHSSNLPPIERIVAAPSGDIWLAETQPDLAAPIRYLVLDSTGAWRGTVIGPPRFQLTSIGDDSVLGLWLDPDDVAHVREYRLIPGA